MNKTKIEWCDSTWNPVTGCQHSCPYCYARNIAHRFSYEGETLDAPAELQKIWIEDSKGSGAGNHVLRYPVHLLSSEHLLKGVRVPYPFGFEPTFHRYRLDEPVKWKKPRTIFVCSMADLFGDWVPDEWIAEVFAACKKAPQHRYLFLTKNPKRYLELYKSKAFPYLDNFWFGTTCTKPNDEFVWFEDTPYKTFVSIEPILEPFGSLSKGKLPQWVIIGAETGNRKNKVVPKPEWIEEIVKECEAANVPLFMKDSLLPIVGEENMRREFPWDKEDS